MYKYEESKEEIFTEDGQVLFIEIRDRANRLLNEAGAFKLYNGIKGSTGSAWRMIACIDRLVELGEIREISEEGVWGQDRVFVKSF